MLFRELFLNICDEGKRLADLEALPKCVRTRDFNNINEANKHRQNGFSILIQRLCSIILGNFLPRWYNTNNPILDSYRPLHVPWPICLQRINYWCGHTALINGAKRWVHYLSKLWQNRNIIHFHLVKCLLFYSSSD